MPIARHGDVELYYEVHGQGRPLLMIQGLGYGIWAWYRQVGDLSTDFRLIVFDNRGVGGSTKVTAPYTVHDMADDAAAVLDAAGEASAHVLGISLGGMVAQSLAARHPHRVRTLVLLATTPGGPEAVPVPAQTAALLADPGEGLTPEQRIRRNMALSFRPGWVEAHPEAFEEVVRLRLPHVPPWEAYVAQAAAGASADCSELLAAIRAPTLVIHGTADGVVPVENAKLLADRIPAARLEILEGAGHLIPIEEPERLHRLVREWCR